MGTMLMGTMLMGTMLMGTMLMGTMSSRNSTIAQKYKIQFDKESRKVHATEYIGN